jgi:hypothetical protein
MGLKNIDYKQILIDRGERIGLGAAGVIALLMLASLFFPGMGFMSGSASSNAEVLVASTNTVQNGLNTDKPTEADNPGDTKAKLVAFSFDLMDEAKTKSYAVAGLFSSPPPTGPSRLMPDLLQPKESRAAVVRLQVSSFVFDSNFQQLLVLDDAPPGGAAGPAGTGGSKMMSSMPSAGMIAKMYGGGVGGGPAGMINPQAVSASGKSRHKSHPGDGSDQEDFKSGFVDIGKIGSNNDKKLAEEALPVRAAEIVASFPYKAQVEEFRDKLGLPSDEQVLAEMSQEVGKDKQPLPAFRFDGVRLERRQVDAQGKPIDDQGKRVDDKSGGAEVNLEDSFKDLVILDGKRFEDEDPKLVPVMLSPRLIMRKLLTFGDRRVPPVDEYPKLEEQMPNLKATIETLNSDPNKVVAAPSMTNRDFSIFDVEAGASPQMQPGGTKPPAGMTPSRSPFGPAGSSPPGMPRVFVPPASTGAVGDTPARAGLNGYGAGFLQKDQSFTIPDYILIRLFDVTVKPGRTYEYRMQVRMGNPNKGRTDAASQSFAHQPELPPKDWYVLPEKVTVPLDVNYYAVDQAALDAAAAKAPKDPSQPKEPKEAKLPVQRVKENQTTLQIQKWMDTLKTKREEQPIGDWVIAERVVATRGEPIGPQKVEVPYWRKTQDRFTLASDGPSKSGRRGPPRVDVSFSEGDEPILVDFTGGDVSYKPTRPGSQALPVADKGTAVDVLLLMADGTLAAHDSAQDAVDAKRVLRLKENRDFIHEVKNTKGGKMQDTPFGPGGTGTSSPFNLNN